MLLSCSTPLPFGVAVLLSGTLAFISPKCIYEEPENPNSFFNGLPNPPMIVDYEPPVHQGPLDYDGIRFQYIAAIPFQMGSPASENGSFSWERPRHTVHLPRGFYIAITEITQSQWKNVMGSIPFNEGDPAGDRIPMQRISWYDAREFAAALSARHSPLVFRLPTEAEWELACRGDTTTRFYWGDDSDSTVCDLNAWTAQNSGLLPHIVGQLQPNMLGLYDMSGNQAEWVMDRWHDTYDGAPTDGSAWGTPERTDGDDPIATIYGVLRGGNWNWDPNDDRSASRYEEFPDSRRPYSGFRLVFTP